MIVHCNYESYNSLIVPVFQLTHTMKYNDEYAAKQTFLPKFYYKMERNWVAGFAGEKADTADQDQDKTKTYDHARIEYAQMDSILYLDSDEIFFCPQASRDWQQQRDYQQSLMTLFASQGIEEMRYLRLPYAGL